jgi:CDP-diacylglycerol--glycerol-3-phosphate 3-phosphatidyltransferase
LHPVESIIHVMEKTSYYIINAITFYRVLAAPVLFLLIFTGQTDLFKWLLGLSFFTDAIDGYLARRYKVTSVAGARLDSLGDDLTVLAGIVGLFVLRNDFISRQYLWVAVLLVLLAVQVVAAFWRYGKMTSFHTWLAKTAAVIQGIFLISAFFMPEPSQLLFYMAVAVTALELLEEIVLVFLLPVWKVNVKGLYWVLKQRRER